MEWRSSWAGRRGLLLVSNQPVIPNVEGTCAIQAVADALQARFKITDMREGKIRSHALPYSNQFAWEMSKLEILGDIGADIDDVLFAVIHLGIPVGLVDLQFPNYYLDNGRKHRKIRDYITIHVEGEHEANERLLRNEIKINGPVIGVLVLAKDFRSSNGHIYGSINNPNMRITRGDGTFVYHAVAITGYGWRPDGQSFLEFQNNWGIEPHMRGIGTMLYRALTRVYIPIVN